MEQNQSIPSGSARLRDRDLQGQKVAATQFRFDIEFVDGEALSVTPAPAYTVEGALETIDIRGFEKKSVERIIITKVEQ